MRELSAKRRSALDAGAFVASPWFTLRDCGPQARFIVRGDDTIARTAGGALGLDLPREACRSTERPGLAALWLGPDEWLLVAGEEEQARLGEELARAVAGLPASVVDVSHAYAGLVAGGPAASEVLNAGCLLDLHAQTFPVGSCTRTLFVKATVVLWRRGPSEFRLEIGRSYATYAAALLCEAASCFETLRADALALRRS